MGFVPQMQRLIDMALNHREVFDVLSPAERRLRDNARVQVALIQRLSKEDLDGGNRQYSVDYQLRMNREYASREGFAVVAEASDTDVSGATFDRPCYQALKQRVSAGKLQADRFVFAMPDRFARDTKEALTELEELEGMGIVVAFSDPLFAHIDTSTSTGRVLLLEAFIRAEYERLMLIHRTRLGLREARSKGVQLGTFPKHFRRDGEGRIVPTKKASQACRRRVDGESWGTIARDLRMSRREVRNIIHFVGRKATEARVG